MVQDKTTTALVNTLAQTSSAFRDDLVSIEETKYKLHANELQRNANEKILSKQPEKEDEKELKKFWHMQMEECLEELSPAQVQREQWQKQTFGCVCETSMVWQESCFAAFDNFSCLNTTYMASVHHGETNAINIQKFITANLRETKDSVECKGLYSSFRYGTLPDNNNRPTTNPWMRFDNFPALTDNTSSTENREPQTRYPASQADDGLVRDDCMVEVDVHRLMSQYGSGYKAMEAMSIKMVPVSENNQVEIIGLEIEREISETTSSCGYYPDRRRLVLLSS